MKERKVRIIGIRGCRLPRDIGRLLEGCTTVFSSSRLKEVLEGQPGILPSVLRILPITPVDAMIGEIRRLQAVEGCAVLASGDPLFFGIGRRLISALGKEKLEFHPAISAIQAACARLGIPWDDAQIISLHGRKGSHALAGILRHPKSIILTDSKNSPDSIARRLLEILEEAKARDFQDAIRIHVAEDLDCPGERVRSMDLAQAAAETFSPLNITVIETPCSRRMQGRGIGMSEQEIGHLRGLITKDEIRAVVLHKLRLAQGILLWDIGAGSGSISLEAARLFPDITAFAVERDGEMQAIIRGNIRKFGLFNIVPVDGEAPGILNSLPAPERVFIGGSGGKLAPVIAHCARVLPPWGIMVATAILDSTARDAPALMHDAGLKVDISRIAVVRRRYPGGNEHKLNEITIIRGIKMGDTTN